MAEAFWVIVSVVLLTFRSFCLVECIGVHLVGSFVQDKNQLIHYEIMKPALELAVEEANKKFNSSHLEFKLTMVSDSDSCYYSQVGGLISQIHYGSQPIHALFGPACELALDQAARMASYWNIPIFTAGGWSTEFSDKDTYATLTRLSYSLDRITDFFFLILKEMDWHHVAMLTDERDPTMSLLRRALIKNLEKYSEVGDYQLEIAIQTLVTSRTFSNETIDTKSILEQAAQTARVFLLLVPSSETVRDILLTAYDLGWSNGEHAFVAFELLKSKSSKSQQDTSASEISWYQLGSRRNKEAKLMFESLLVIKVRIETSQEFSSFAYKVARKASSDSSNSRRYTPADVNPIVGSFYDSIMLYMGAINQTINSGNDPTDGRSIIRHIWDRTTYDAMSGDLVINSNGDREADYMLTDLDPESGNMIPVAVYYGGRKAYQKYPGVDIRWPNNSPPPDRPKCGFRDEDPICAEASQTPLIVSIVVLIVLVSSSGIGALLFAQNRIRKEAELNDLWWKISREELEFLDKKNADNRIKSSVSLIVSNVSLGTRSVRSNRSSRAGSTNFSTTIINLEGIDIANFRGLKVAVKELNTFAKIHVTRDLLVQMKTMRECQVHDNLVKLYGLIIEEPYCMVTELCPRGSLRDILENESLNIDWIFRYSILTDVVEGMYYLHQTPIEYHGHLKSSNLLVDGRFTVKISDYGLRFLYHDQKTESTNPRTLFWTAPEHLRSRDPLSSGSQKGDVYSFAIICQELITRNGPYEPSPERRANSVFGNKTLDPDEILDRVRMGGIPPFRPDLTADDCIECPDLLTLVRKCWSENANDRPDFGRVKINLRKICKGASSKNFLDNLLKRMEQYSNSLEMMVNEKTQGLVEEKARAEELIYQMLPKFIAEELKLGKHVAPETFDSVTIFFSEILGFKEWTMKSRPGETVTLLNEIYSTIEGVMANYNVYKVETVTDSYLVASGLPVRNGNEHAREIARMALDLRIAMRNFKSPTSDGPSMAIRMGFHSGSCVAGVIGLKMPKYCLFGDTINTASRMETTGEAGKVQISSVSKAILDLFGNFIILPRGEVEVKGKGKLKTFWLEGEDRSFR